MIIVFLTGGPSHIDTFDLKPDAPAEIRGEFKPIATKIPGVSFCEHLPRFAARADKLAVVRSFSHPQTNHLLATHHVLTGAAIPGGKFDQVVLATIGPTRGRPRRSSVCANDGVRRLASTC